MKTSAITKGCRESDKRKKPTSFLSTSGFSHVVLLFVAAVFAVVAVVSVAAGSADGGSNWGASGDTFAAAYAKFE